MTVKEVFELQRSGQTEEAYEAARQLYAADKGRNTTVCMFWAAINMLRLRTNERKTDEAVKIYQALERVLSRMDDNEGKARSALDAAKWRLDDAMRTDDPEHKASHAQLGKWGEALAERYLQEKGYTILERNWLSGHRDIDIVAQDGDTVVFVEVKTRSNNDFRSPEEAVGYWKQHHLLQSINHYIHYRHLDCPWRFDVVAIVGNMSSTPVINHIEDFALSAR